MNDCSRHDHGFDKKSSSWNINAHFIAPNPKTKTNPRSVHPSIDDTAYVGPFSTIIGDVTVRENVFVAPNVSIRADEGTPFYVNHDTNIQDGVILHGLASQYVCYEGKKFSIYIGKHVSCAHGCLIHGPCKIGDHAFIGFHAIVMNAIIGEGCYLSPNVLVTGGVKVLPNRFLPAGIIVDKQEVADRLRPVPQSEHEFAHEVQRVNQQFPHAYSLMFGDTKCSCGLTCHSHSLRSLMEM